jgi:uncharacterized protein involved in exopolysaccharide biosynthesis
LEQLQRLERAGNLQPAFHYQRTLGDYVAGLRRRAGLAVLVGTVILAVGLGAATLLPSIYRSSGTILIEQQVIPTDLVRSTVTSFATERIQVIGQRVMTTSNLVSVIERYNLYTEDRADTPIEVVVDRMREDIDVSMISANVRDQSGRASRATIAFKVSFEHEVPAVAQRVANELVTLYLNENLETRTELARETTSFLASETRKLSQEITRYGDELADFKREHEGLLPAQQTLLRSKYERAQEGLEASQRQVERLQQTRQMLVKQLAVMDPYESTGNNSNRVATLNERLRELRYSYVNLRSQYWADHPDLVQIKRTIDGLVREALATGSAADLRLALIQIEDQLVDLQELPDPDPAEADHLESTAAVLRDRLENAGQVTEVAVRGVQGATNPAYVQLQSQLAGLEIEIDSQAALQERLRKELTTLEAQLGKAPDIEREYTALLRDYENALDQYREMKAKETDARLAQTLESEQKAERFTLIEPPRQPQKPVRPNRTGIAAVGVLGALAGAIGVVYLGMMLDRSIRGGRRLGAVLGEVPLSVIPPIVLPEERARKRRRVLLVAGGAGAGVLVAGLLLAHFFYSPLDILWFRVLRAAGLMA